MPDPRTFNPNGTLVVKRSRGLKLGGRQYDRGTVILQDGKPQIDCIALRKIHQLYSQGFLCYDYELSELDADPRHRRRSTLVAAQLRAAEEERDEDDEVPEVVKRANSDAPSDAETLESLKGCASLNAILDAAPANSESDDDGSDDQRTGPRRRVRRARPDAE